MSILNHEFEDCIAEMEVSDADKDKIIISFQGQWIFFNRDDVAAMTKHFEENGE